MATRMCSVLLMLALSITIASSLQCYKCYRENEPEADKYCNLPTSSLGNNQIVNCTSGENRCVIKKMVEKDSVTLFRRGCGKQDDCTDKCTADSARIQVCDSCCDEDLCNKGMGPKPAELSGTSRNMIARSLYAFGVFLMLLLL